MKPNKQQIIPPANGWKAQSLYLVEVAFNDANVIHTAIFYTGYLTDGKPSGYNELCLYDDKYTISDVVYLRALKFVIEQPRTHAKTLSSNIGKTILQGGLDTSAITL